MEVYGSRMEEVEGVRQSTDVGPLVEEDKLSSVY
jgi:hypothetical protein